MSESKLKADPQGHNDGGRAAGIVQIHYETWGFTKEEVLDPEFSLRFAAKHIKADTAWKYWTPLNCYIYLKFARKIPLPPTAQLWPNSEAHIGAVALFRYSNGVRHYAEVIGLSEGRITLMEANFEPGKVGKRTIAMTDPHLQGFWSPS